MASFQIENGTCNGRGFSGIDANGWLAKFFTWVTKAPAAGGPGWYIIDDQSALGTDPYIIVSDVAVPTLNAYNTGQSGGHPKIQKVGYATAVAATVRVQNYLWWDTTAHWGSGIFSGYELDTVDAGDFAYDFRGGAETMIQQTRIGTSWNSCILDDWIGDSNLVEGPDKIGVIQSGVSIDSDVLLHLGTGEAYNFTSGNFYFMVDVSNGPQVSYVQCNEIDHGTDELVVNSTVWNHPSGTLIGAYPHRVYSASNGIAQYTNISARTAQIPYVSDTEKIYNVHEDNSIIWGYIRYDSLNLAISTMDPNDLETYAVQRPVLGEYYRFMPTSSSTNATVGMNRYYGIAKNLYCTQLGTMARGQDGRIIGGENWLYFLSGSELFAGGDASQAMLYRDTESVS